MRIPSSALKVTALALWLSVSVSGQASLASLSSDLLALVLGGSTQQVRAIIRGDVATIQSIAAPRRRSGAARPRRHGRGQASPTELSVLRQVPGIQSISRDNIVVAADGRGSEGDGGGSGARGATWRAAGYRRHAGGHRQRRSASRSSTRASTRHMRH